jgi:hypothetical protein
MQSKSAVAILALHASLAAGFLLPCAGQIPAPPKNSAHPAAQISLSGLENAAKEKAAEEALTKVLNDNLPLTLNAKDVYPTVTTLPGGPFSPTPLQLTADQLNQPLAPGDYTINTLAFCSEYSVHQPGAGTAYVLGPYEGKAAGAIGALIWRGTEQYGVSPQSLQAVSWAIQSGLTYDQMPKTYQAIIDQVIPDLKSEITGDFVTNLENTYNSLAKSANLPPLDSMLAKLGEPGQLALDAERERQILTAQNTSDELKQQTLFQGQESGIYTPVTAENGPWTERVKGQVYMKLLIAGGNMAANNVMQIRVMPPPPTTSRNADPDKPSRAHMVHAAYGEPQVSSSSLTNFAVTLANLLEGVLGYAQGRGAQALGQVAALVKSALPQPPPPVQANLGNPCGLTQDALSNLETNAANGICACMPSRWNVCSNSTTPLPLWTAEKNNKQALGLSLPEAEVYTDYCIGSKVDGIMFVPKPCPDGSDMRVLQFVNTSCADPHDTACAAMKTLHTTCGDRDLGQWNLDQCPLTGAVTPGKCPSENYYCPDTDINNNGQIIGHIISDEPSPNAPNGSPLKQQFYDVLMCGTQVVDAFQWTRTGLPANQVKRCKEPCPGGGTDCDSVQQPMAGAYSNLNPVNVNPKSGEIDDDLSDAVCDIQNIKNFVNNPLLKSLQAYLECGTP